MTDQWVYGPGALPLPEPAPSDRPMSEAMRVEMARLADMFAKMQSEGEMIAFAVAEFGYRDAPRGYVGDPLDGY